MYPDQSQHQQILSDSRFKRSLDLSGAHSRLRFQGVDLREVIADIRAGNSLDRFPVKAQVGGYEAIFIQEIYTEIERWREAHPDVHGFAKTEVGDFRKIFLNQKVQDPEKIARVESTLLHPLSPEKFRSLRDDLAPYRGDRTREFWSGFTRDVLQYHLFKWEQRCLGISDAGISEGSAITPEVLSWYESYVGLISEYGDGFKRSRYPATSKMLDGFHFGPSKYWRFAYWISDAVHHLQQKEQKEQRSFEAEKEAYQSHQQGALRQLRKEASTHILIIQEFPELRERKFYEEISDERGRKSWRLTDEALKNLFERIPTILSALVDFHDKGNNASFDRFYTRCPAFYTDAFEGIFYWIMNADRATDHRCQLPSSTS